MFPSVVDCEVVKGSDKKSGCSATFAFISETYGLKYWRDVDYAKDNYRKTKFAAEHGLAPKVGSFVSFEIYGETYHGFFMERIERLFYDVHGNAGCSSSNDYSISFEEFEIRDLVQLLKDIGFSTIFDIHAWNAGVLPNGEWVVIDFDGCELPEEIYNGSY